MRSPSTRRFVLLALALTAGCHVTMRPPLAESDSSTSDATEASADVSAPDVATTDGAPSDAPSSSYLAALRSIRVAACERAQRCGTNSDATVNLCVAGTYRFAFEPVAARLARQIALLDSGALTFDPSAVGACIDALTRHCVGDFVVQDVAGPACSNLLHGRAELGAACQATEDCVAGAHCRVTPPGDGGVACTGVCAPPTEGDFCVEAACGSLHCSYSGNRCIRVSFGAPLGLGGRCGAVAEPDGTIRYSGCSAGLSCVRGVEASFYCQTTTCVTPCAHDRACDYTARGCVDVTLLAAGADCSASGTLCDPRRGLYCDASHRCAPRVAEGGACSLLGDCVAGLECIGGVCRRRTIVIGEGCYADSQCESGACSSFRCVTPGCWS